MSTKTKRTLDDLRAVFNKEEADRPRLPNNYYPFYRMKPDQKATIRILPDANPDNPLGFFIEKHMHTLDINGERKSVPCLKMYGEECPICKVSSQYYNNNDKESGKKYYKKRQYILQVLVVNDPLPADEETGETHQGQVRFVALGHQLFSIIKAAIMDDDQLDAPPFDYEEGYDFVIRKTQNGEYPSYTTSSFARKPRALDEDELQVVEENLADLSTLLPKAPALEKVEAMLEAALTGGTFDDEASDDAHDVEEETPRVSKTTKVAPAKKTKPVVEDDEDDDVPTKPSKNAETLSEMDDLFEVINRRRKAAKSD